jgi:hypothetical protein
MIVDTMSYAGLSFLSGVVVGVLGKGVDILLKNRGHHIQGKIYYFIGRKRAKFTEKSNT